MGSFINFLPDDIIYSIVYYIDNSKDLNNFIVNYSYKHNDDFWKNIFYQHIPKAKIFLTNENYKIIDQRLHHGIIDTVGNAFWRDSYFKLRYPIFYDVGLEKIKKSKLHYPYGHR